MLCTVRLNLLEQCFGEVGQELSFLLLAAMFRKTTEVLVLVSRDADLVVMKPDWWENGLVLKMQVRREGNMQ